MRLSPNSSSNTNVSYSFLAEGVEKISGTHFDETEDLEVFFETKERVYEMLMNGDFHQSLMVAPLWKYFALKL